MQSLGCAISLGRVKPGLIVVTTDAHVCQWCCLLLCVCPVCPAAELSSARAQAASLSEVAAGGQALKSELEAELQGTQQQLQHLTATLTDSNTVRA
jgi:hypothetical protein